jgi:hypothetical protein
VPAPFFRPGAASVVVVGLVLFVGFVGFADRERFEKTFPLSYTIE